MSLIVIDISGEEFDHDIIDLETEDLRLDVFKVILVRYPLGISKIHSNFAVKMKIKSFSNYYMCYVTEI